MDVEIKNKSQQKKNNENDYLRADYAEAMVPHQTAQQRQQNYYGVCVY